MARRGKLAEAPRPLGAGSSSCSSSSLATEETETDVRPKTSQNTRSLKKYMNPEFSEATSVLTWNVAAVNNNPFEYWIAFEDDVYKDLMQGVESFLDDPQENDVEVRQVFTEAMFKELAQLCAKEQMLGLEELEQDCWAGGQLRLGRRKIVTEFVKDASLGAKRLISMPDRVTNTINVVTRKESGYRPPPVCRPCVINNYEGDLSTMEVWWEDWKKFMFATPLSVRTRSGSAVQRPVDMLEPILRSKYPAVTEQEERLALPLQLLCQAIFDAVIVHFMNELSPCGEWQVVKSKICEKLYRRKHTTTMEILAKRYNQVHVICLQEVAAVFKDTLEDSALRDTHHLVLPARLDGKRDQNSLILLRKDAWRLESVREVTHVIAGHLEEGFKLADGDLLAIEVACANLARPYLIVSFHGDTNGLLTMPLLRAVEKVLKTNFEKHLVLLALDANVYEQEKDGRKPFGDFIKEIVPMGLTTCWGDNPQVERCRTTCSARTSLQPQLNKAVRYKDRISKGDKNPKDIILFFRTQFEVVPHEKLGHLRPPNPMKDNTGKIAYIEDAIFPTMDFPSDHGILAVAVQPISP